MLELPERLSGARTEVPHLGGSRHEPGRCEPTLQVTDGLAALALGQWEDGRNSCNSCNRAPLPFAPTIFLATSPFWNTKSVGMLMTL